MDGIERIKVLASEITNKPMLKVIEHLLSREDMNEKYLNEEKSLKQMISFIRGEAKKQAEDGCACVEDEDVYSWAIHYWDESNESLGLTKKEAKKDKIEQLTEEVEELDSKEDVKVEKIDPVKNKKEWIPEGQLSLF